MENEMMYGEPYAALICAEGDRERIRRTVEKLTGEGYRIRMSTEADGSTMGGETTAELDGAELIVLIVTANAAPSRFFRSALDHAVLS